MSGFISGFAEQNESSRDNPVLRQEPYSPSEQRKRWEVRAAQWRARELAQLVFGDVSDMGLSGIRGGGRNAWPTEARRTIRRFVQAS